MNGADGVLLARLERLRRGGAPPDTALRLPSLSPSCRPELDRLIARINAQLGARGVSVSREELRAQILELLGVDPHRKRPFCDVVLARVGGG
jgi:hypothetical protein